MKGLDHATRVLALSVALLPAGSWAKAATEVVNHGTIVNVNSAPAEALPELKEDPRATKMHEDEIEALKALAARLPVALPEPKVQAPAKDPHERGLSLGGPRFGVTFISGGGVDKLRAEVAKSKPGASVEPTMSQFGWQIEYRMFKTEQGLTALTEVIPSVGGLDQGLALPSLVWLVGVRGANGFEIGVGPSVGLDGGGLMAGIGFTFDLGGINVPLNLAYGRGANQTSSVSISTGFNL